MGLRLNFPNASTICYVEIEAYVCAFLEKRMREGILDDAPIWTNLKSFDGKPWCGKVDCLTAGYPCQPFSIAGKKPGEKDPRHLWPEVCRVIRECQPAICFLENVGAHLRMGFEQVHDDLCTMGYEIKSGCLQRKKWVRRTNEKDCSSWPTILVSCGKGVSAKELSSGNPRFRLDVAVRLWPTATVIDSAIQTVRPPEKMICKNGRNVLRTPSLAETVLQPEDFPRYKQDLEKSWRTSCASDGAGGLMYPNKNRSPRLKLLEQSVHMKLSPYGHHVPMNKNNGKESQQTLNPQFTEWLMGWPIGWTDFAPVEMAWSHWWQHMRSEFFALISKI